MHPTLLIDVAIKDHQERVAKSLASYAVAQYLADRSTPRATVARALVALAGRIAPNTSVTRADLA